MLYPNNSNEFGTYAAPCEADPPFGLPPHQPEPVRKSPRRSRMAGYVAGVLAVSMVSGVAGGGVSYWLLKDSLAATGPESSAISSVGTIVPTLAPTNQNIAAIASKASVSVVEINITATSFNPFFGESVSQGSGSGVVVTEDGYIVTNNHVVESAGSITVRTADGQEYDATFVGTDAKTDLAVIKIDADGLDPVSFADSDAVQVGELAVAIGNSLGSLGGTVTEGIVSARDRQITIGDETMSLFQTSAAVNPGNSGGGLFNSSGELIGIVNAKSYGVEVEGLGFAIPSNTVQEVMAELMDNGYVTGRAELGVRVVEILDQESAMRYRLQDLGVYVVDVTRDNGLQPGDLIVSVEGTPISENEHLTDILAEHAVGDSLEFVIKRGGERLTLSVTLGEQVPNYIQQRLEESSSL